MSSTLTTASAVTFTATFVAKYTKTIVGCYTYRNFKPRPVSDDPKYTTEDVSVVIPTTFGEAAKLKECVEGVLKSQPSKVFVVCPNEHVLECKELLFEEGRSKITVLGVPKLNKRVQILKALEYVVTDIIILADDDVFWPNADYVNLLLAIFEDDRVGAGGTRQRVRREAVPSIWNFLGIGYLERRTWNNATTNAIDGTISTLSGRTAAYRAEILQTDEFRHYFLNDSWRGKPLNSDDDKCLTRYVYSLGWKIAIQFDHRAVLETTVEIGTKYLAQCQRWARAHWRGNFTVMENEKYWRSLQMLWGTYVIYFGSFLTPAILWEGIMWFALYGAINETRWAVLAYILFGLFIFVTKVVKYIPHFNRNPQDMIFIPVAIAFSYFHGFLNLYCLATMTTTHWGSRDLNPVSAAREGINMTTDFDHEIKHATSGNEFRYSVDGRDHFKVTIPGSPVMSKEGVQEYLADLARQSELPFGDDDEEMNGLKGHLFPDLNEELCDVLSKQLCHQEEEERLTREKAAQVLFEKAEREEDERLSKEEANGIHSPATYEYIEVFSMESTDTEGDSTEEGPVPDAVTKAACTNGCPGLARVYDSLPMLMRN